MSLPGAWTFVTDAAEPMPSNAVVAELVCEPDIIHLLIDFVSFGDSWAFLNACTETYLWANIATRGTPAERSRAVELIQSDPELQVYVRLWGFKYN